MLGEIFGQLTGEVLVGLDKELQVQTRERATGVFVEGEDRSFA